MPKHEARRRALLTQIQAIETLQRALELRTRRAAAELKKLAVVKTAARF